MSSPLGEYLSGIKPLDRGAMDKARGRLDGLLKPPDSLGVLEDIAVTLAGISGQVVCDVSKRCVIVACSDNGVVEEEVASAPQEITRALAMSTVRGITGISVLARQFGADVIVVDLGINADISHPLIRNKKIRKSTGNIAKQEAMTRDEAVKSILVGIETAAGAVQDGYRLLGAGEMGIGNTTTSAAALCALTGISPENAAGKGAGLTEEGYRRKIKIIQTALSERNPNPDDPIDVLAKVGGFDIAAMAGVYIGGAYMGVPVVIDGFISIVAALIAARLSPAARRYMIASHKSKEQGFNFAAKALDIKPCLHLDMRLGEGSGCPLMFAVIDAACAVIRDMGTLASIGSGGEEYLNALKEDTAAI